MYCSACGKWIKTGDKFCPSCGSRAIPPPQTFPSHPLPQKQPPIVRYRTALVACWILLIFNGILALGGMFTESAEGWPNSAGIAMVVFFGLISLASLFGVIKSNLKIKSIRKPVQQVTPVVQPVHTKAKKTTGLKRAVPMPIIILASIAGLVGLTAVSFTRYGGIIFLICAGLVIMVILCIHKAKRKPAIEGVQATLCQKCRRQIDDIEVVCPYCGQETPLYAKEVEKARRLEEEDPQPCHVEEEEPGGQEEEAVNREEILELLDAHIDRLKACAKEVEYTPDPLVIREKLTDENISDIQNRMASFLRDNNMVGCWINNVNTSKDCFTVAIHAPISSIQYSRLISLELTIVRYLASYKCYVHGDSFQEALTIRIDYREEKKEQESEMRVEYGAGESGYSYPEFMRVIKAISAEKSDKIDVASLRRLARNPTAVKNIMSDLASIGIIGGDLKIRLKEFNFDIPQ